MTNPLPVMKYRSLGLSRDAFTNIERSIRFAIRNSNRFLSPSFLSKTPHSNGF